MEIPLPRLARRATFFKYATADYDQEHDDKSDGDSQKRRDDSSRGYQAKQTSRISIYYIRLDCGLFFRSVQIRIEQINKHLHFVSSGDVSGGDIKIGRTRLFSKIFGKDEAEYQQ
jgi:hypothetical protein